MMSCLKNDAKALTKGDGLEKLCHWEEGRVGEEGGRWWFCVSICASLGVDDTPEYEYLALETRLWWEPVLSVGFKNNQNTSKHWGVWY